MSDWSLAAEKVRNRTSAGSRAKLTQATGRVRERRCCLHATNGDKISQICRRLACSSSSLRQLRNLEEAGRITCKASSEAGDFVQGTHECATPFFPATTLLVLKIRGAYKARSQHGSVTCLAHEHHNHQFN
jgi:hypothetical protein